MESLLSATLAQGTSCRWDTQACAGLSMEVANIQARAADDARSVLLELRQQEQLTKLRAIVKRYEVQHLNFADASQIRSLLAYVVARGTRSLAAQQPASAGPCPASNLSFLEDALRLSCAHHGVRPLDVYVSTLENICLVSEIDHGEAARGASWAEALTHEVMAHLKNAPSFSVGDAFAVGIECLTFCLDSIESECSASAGHLRKDCAVERRQLEHYATVGKVRAARLSLLVGRPPLRNL